MEKNKENVLDTSSQNTIQYNTGFHLGGEMRHCSPPKDSKTERVYQTTLNNFVSLLLFFAVPHHNNAIPVCIYFHQIRIFLQCFYTCTDKHSTAKFVASKLCLGFKQNKSFFSG